MKNGTINKGKEKMISITNITYHLFIILCLSDIVSNFEVAAMCTFTTLTGQWNYGRCSPVINNGQLQVHACSVLLSDLCHTSAAVYMLFWFRNTLSDTDCLHSWTNTKGGHRLLRLNTAIRAPHSYNSY